MNVLFIKRILIPVLCILLSFHVDAQQAVSDLINREDRAASFSAHEKAAQKAYEKGDFSTAMVRYGQLVDTNNLKASILNGYGESALNAQQYDKAEWAFQTMVDKGLIGSDGKAYLELAGIHYVNEKYALAKKTYKRFLEDTRIKNMSPKTIEDVHNAMDNCDWALSVKDNPIFKTPMKRLDTGQVNTWFSEISPFPLGDKLYFASHRFPFEHDKNYPKRRLFRTLETTLKEGKMEAHLVDFNEENQHTSNVIFNESENVMYYTIGHYIDSMQIQCAIYRRKKKQDNTWGPAEKLPDYINQEGSTNTEPSIGRGPGEDSEVLYFVSNRKGGKGKRDIWYSYVKGDSIGLPVNLGDTINTPGDEVTPFYYSNMGILYFSTDGQKTLGGLDVYQSRGTAGKTWSTPEHMMKPVNTGHNDVYYTINRQGTTAFVSSNRKVSWPASSAGPYAGTLASKQPGLNGNSDHDDLIEEECCYDLYSADFVTPKATAVTFCKPNGDSLSGTNLRLIELGKSGVILSDKPYSLSGPRQSLDLLTGGHKYMIIASKDQYVSDTVRFESPAYWTKESLIEKLYLGPSKVDLIVTVLDKSTKKPVTGAKACLTDMCHPKIEVKPKTAQNEYCFRYPMESAHKYKIVVTKEGFPADSIVNICSADLKDCSQTLRDTLYLNCEKEDTVMGISLFFDNDVPSRKGHPEDTTTNLIYFKGGKVELGPDAFSVYYEKRFEFIQEYCQVISDPYYEPTEPLRKASINLRKKSDLNKLELVQYRKDSTEMAHFFEYARQQNDELNTFLGKLQDLLISNPKDTFEIVFSGYASTLAPASYNYNLTKRRVNSIKNYVYHFDVDLEKIYGSRVKARLVPLGNQDSVKKGITGDPRNPRGAIYGVEASRERRVDITAVNKTKKN